MYKTENYKTVYNRPDLNPVPLVYSLVFEPADADKIDMSSFFPGTPFSGVVGTFQTGVK